MHAIIIIKTRTRSRKFTILVEICPSQRIPCKRYVVCREGDQCSSLSTSLIIDLTKEPQEGTSAVRLGDMWRRNLWYTGAISLFYHESTGFFGLEEQDLDLLS